MSKCWQLGIDEHFQTEISQLKFHINKQEVAAIQVMEADNYSV